MQQIHLANIHLVAQQCESDALELYPFDMVLAIYISSDLSLSLQP